jgi:hypothetical protein
MENHEEEGLNDGRGDRSKTNIRDEVGDDIKREGSHQEIKHFIYSPDLFAAPNAILVYDTVSTPNTIGYKILAGTGPIESVGTSFDINEKTYAVTKTKTI